MRAVPLCLALLLASVASPQARSSWHVGTGGGAGSGETSPAPEPLAIAAIALSIKSRAIQDSRCYLMNGGAVESFFISEDTPVGSIIGTLSVNGDPDEELGDITLRLQERGAAVGVAPGTKNLTLLRALDREEKTGPSNVYVNVRCDRRGTTDPSFVIPVSVRVWDVNDNAPAWEGVPYRARLSELSAAGARVPLAARARDADQAGPHAAVHYSVVPGPHSEFFSFPNELDSTLVIKKPLDYESLPNFNVTLRASDAGSPPLHNDTVLMVEVLDADDQNPKFSREHYTAIVPDDAKEGTILSISPEAISAVDQDAGINAPLQYSVTGAGAALLRVEPDSGRVAATARLLAELAQPLTLVIKATQVDNADRYALATLTVSRGTGGGGGGGGGAGAGVRFRRRQYSAAVSEAAPPGAVLLALHTDPPHRPAAHNELQFYVSDRGFLDKFAINGAGEVLLRRPLDYEAEHSYHYQVMVTDGQANDTASINITVIDVNEWEPRFRHPQYEFRLEGGRGGELLPVGRLEVFDGDAADTVSLSLRGPDASLLYVNASGELWVRGAALRARPAAAAAALHAVATAEDSGQPPRQTSVPVTVHVSPRLLRGAGAGAGAGEGEREGAAAVPLFGAALAALALLVCALLLYIYRVRRRSKRSAGNVSKGGGYVAHEKPPPSGAAPPGAPAAPAALRAVPSSGSLLSVSAGASTILANSSSSLDLRADPLPGIGHQHTGSPAGRAPRGRVAPLPGAGAAGAGEAGEAGAALMSDHLAGRAGGAGGRSGVAWPAATIPARVKQLSWDPAPAPARPHPHQHHDRTEDSGPAAPADLTVYF